MSFSRRISDFVAAVFMDDEAAAKRLPLRPTAKIRENRMSSQHRALDWRLQVQEAATAVRAELNGEDEGQVAPRMALERPVIKLLKLLGEDDDL